MTDWSALGPDPAPGDPDAARELARSVGRIAVLVAGSAAQMRDLACTGGGWSGEAAEAYSERLGFLPQHLDDAAAALQRVERALHAFAAFLDDAQVRARRLAAQALEAEAQLPDPGAAVRLQAWRQSADALEGEVRRASLEVERALDGAARLAPDEPGWLHRFVAEHTWVLEVVSVTAGVVAAVAAATGAGVVVAAPLAGISWAATYTLHHYGEADDADLLLATVGFGAVGASAAALRAAGAASAAATPSAFAGLTPALASPAARRAALGEAADGVGHATTAGGGVRSVSGWVRDDRCPQRPVVLAPERPRPQPVLP